MFTSIAGAVHSKGLPVAVAASLRDADGGGAGDPGTAKSYSRVNSQPTHRILEVVSHVRVWKT